MKDRILELIDGYFSCSKPPTPHHGRSRACFSEEMQCWLHFKGGGWTWGSKLFLSSQKEDLIFGLYDLKSAQRELAVSKWFNNQKELPVCTTEVLGWANLKDISVFQSDVYDVSQYILSSKKVPNPVVLITKSQTQYRVFDLLFFDEQERRRIFYDAWGKKGVSQTDACIEFVKLMARSLANLHIHGGSNDSLVWDNVTILGEWTDFEWIYVPGIPQFCGSTDEKLFARQWKNCFDTMEIIDRLIYMICTKEDSVRNEYMIVCLEEYEKHNGPIPFREDWL